MAPRYFRPNHTASKPWYRANSGTRFDSDRVIVAELIPTLQFRVDEQLHVVFLEGSMEFVAECGLPRSIIARIEFPRDYPNSEPRVFDTAQKFKALPGKTLADRHLSDEGQCCLWLPPNTLWCPMKPDALREFLLHVIVFFDRQFIYDVTQEWPGPAYAHGREGYLEFIQEQLASESNLFPQLFSLILRRQAISRNDRCPCGSGRKYKVCHAQLVETIQRKIGMDKLYKLAS